MDMLIPNALIPPPLTARARPNGRWGRVLGFGLTARGLLLLLAGLLAALPSFYHPGRIWIMLAWDAVLAGLIVWDAWMLPAPGMMEVTRRFVDAPAIGEETEIAYTVVQESGGIVTVTATDALHPALLEVPQAVEVIAFPRDAVSGSLVCHPRHRGDVILGSVFLRYRGALGMVERWAVCEGAQRVRVFPATEQAGQGTELALTRARQLEMQKRQQRLRGIGREFESLREYQRGDELRNISWTATARRAKLITRSYTTERSQQVWLVLDAGRLSRTAYRLRADLFVTQLDQAATAAMMLAQVIGGSGDRFALLTYGRRVQQQLLPGHGTAHLRLMLDLLSQTRSERAEADHLGAAARLKHLQRRRGLILWVTEMADSIGRPEVVAAAVELVKRHLVVLVLLEHPELTALAMREPETVEQMFQSTAAQQVLERRQAAIVELRRQRVFVVETTPGELGAKAIAKYIEVKAQGLI